TNDERKIASLRIIADHARATAFLIADGLIPSNEGRGYVLRRIMRRAMWHGRELRGGPVPLMTEMVIAVQSLMRSAYPEIVETGDIIRIVFAEEKRFENTLEIGVTKFHEDINAIRKLSDPIKELLPQSKNIYAGERAFRLYDTFGLPKDLIKDIVRDQGWTFDDSGFESAMAEQRKQARASWKVAAKQTANPAYQQLPKSEFEGYRQTRSENCELLAIIKNGLGVQELKAGEQGEVILDQTPFYAESGGQVGDRGVLYSDELNAVVAEVTGCYYPVQGVRAHQVVVKSPPSAKGAEGWGTLKVGDKVDAVVDTGIRQATMRNHTATHLLQAGLREVLGKHVKQAGSLVAPIICASTFPTSP